jgi:purine-cytosine permease-like protein
MFSADYARYVSPNKSVFSVFKWPALGGFIGNFLLLMLAYVLYNNGGIIVNKSGILLDNNGFNGHYVFLTFSIFAITGLLMANFLTSYSSAFSVSTFLEKDYNRVILVIIDAFIATMVSVYLIFVSGSFIDAFEDFLSLGVLISAPWTSIFIIHVFTKIIFKINSLKIKTNIYLFLLSFVVELLVSYSNVIEYYLLPQGTLMGPILGFITPIVCSFVIIVWRTKLWQKLLQEKPLKQY